MIHLNTLDVQFIATQNELSEMGYDHEDQLIEDFLDNLEHNFPKLDQFFEIDRLPFGFTVECDTEEIADTIAEELTEFVQYRSNMVSDAINFEVGRQQADIKQAIDELEKTLAKLKNLLV